MVGWGRRAFGPINIRLALIVLIAAIPLLLLATVLTLQNYRLALNITAETAARLRESAIARHATAIAGAREMLQALSEVDSLIGADEKQCSASLANLLSLESDRYVNLSTSGPDGALRCSARPLPQPQMVSLGQVRNATLYNMARQRRDLVLGPVRASALTGLDVIPAVYPITRGGQVMGFIYAALKIDWFVKPVSTPITPLQAVWLSDSSGRITQVSSTGALGLPPAPLLARLQQNADVVDATSTGGAPYAYASAMLGNGYSLIVAYPAKQDLATARMVLLRRIGELALLLLLGLAALALGANQFLVKPMGKLSKAVTDWQQSGQFNAASFSSAPTELCSMAQAFANATELLAAHEARHRVAVAQQELLMKEIHHRVKNNLQIVASLLNLQASRIRLPEARAEFASARDRVRTLATLHRHLYLQSEVHTINMPLFLAELCDQLFQAMGEVPGQRIKLCIQASPLQLVSDQAVPLSLIVTEAVSNALKYAFPLGRHGTIHVQLAALEDHAELIVADDGVGMPAPGSTPDGPHDGIGITLIRGFARQLNATLVVTEAGGTSYQLRIPINKENSADSDELAA